MLGLRWHHSGHMIAVAFRLLAVGGTNPAGGPYGGVVVTGQGLAYARRVFFNIVQLYATSGTQWCDLGYLAGYAAKQISGSCTSALAENAMRAFEAVGVPRRACIGLQCQ